MNSSDLKTLFHECMPLFIALGDEMRLTIVESLADTAIKNSNGDFSVESLSKAGLNVREITEQTNLSRPAISHHLKLLKDAGIVGVRKEKTSNYYYLTIFYGTKKLTELGEMLQAFLGINETIS